MPFRGTGDLQMYRKGVAGRCRAGSWGHRTGGIKRGAGPGALRSEERARRSWRRLTRT